LTVVLSAGAVDCWAKRLPPTRELSRSNVHTFLLMLLFIEVLLYDWINVDPVWPKRFT
jgi:hypothetical protein